MGIGPGGEGFITLKAKQALQEAEVILGYQRYVDRLKEMELEELEGKELLGFKMGEEITRGKFAVELAESGRRVALVSSGDPGVYGMAGPVLEILHNRQAEVEAEVIPGVTAANAAAAVLGAPLNHDFAVISLSDLLTPWPVIEKRLHAAAAGDFVLVLYNPQSTKRQEQLPAALRIILQYRREDTPAGIVRRAGCQEEEAIVTVLGDLLRCFLSEVDMHCTVIVGNSVTRLVNGSIVTPRGYSI